MLGRRGGLLCEPAGKVDFLSSTCHSSSSLTTFAFRSTEVRRFQLNLDSNGDTDPLGMFPPSFYKDK